MDLIDFNSLSFKIRKPSTDLSLPLQSNSLTQIKLQTQNCLTFQDTRASNGEQQTINPFRRTCHLFKHVQHEKKSLQKSQSHSQTHFSQKKLQVSGTSRSQPYLTNLPIQIKQTVTYSLQNFNSFNNNQSKQSKSSIFSTRKCYETQNQDKFIKIQSQGYQNSEQYSLIMDDFNCQMRISDVIPKSSHRRIKTQYQQNEDKFWKIQQIQQKNNVKMNQSKGIFCLTAQEQSSQSTVKQFYFDLREQKQKLSLQKIKQTENKPNTKKKLKQLIYNFVDHLQIMDECQIDPQFYYKLEDCLTSVKKIETLKQNKQENIQITSQKWVKYKKNNNNNLSGEKINSSSRHPSSARNKNKENKQNSHSMKYIQQQSSHKNTKSNVQQSFYGSMKKRKWVF